MKKVVLPLLILVIAGVGAYVFLSKKTYKPAGNDAKEQPLSVGENSDAFNLSFNRLLTAYIGVKDALVSDDTAKASSLARELAIAADSLSVNEIKGDTS